MTESYAITTGLDEGRTICACFEDPDQAHSFVENERQRGIDVDNALAGYQIEAMPQGMRHAPPSSVTVFSREADFWEGGGISDEAKSARTDWPWRFFEGAPRCAWQWTRMICHESRGGHLAVRGSDLDLVEQTYQTLRASLLENKPLFDTSQKTISHRIED